MNLKNHYINRIARINREIEIILKNDNLYQQINMQIIGDIETACSYASTINYLFKKSSNKDINKKYTYKEWIKFNTKLLKILKSSDDKFLEIEINQAVKNEYKLNLTIMNSYEGKKAINLIDDYIRLSEKILNRI
jgi:hypothetical protein